MSLLLFIYLVWEQSQQIYVILAATLNPKHLADVINPSHRPEHALQVTLSSQRSRQLLQLIRLGTREKTYLLSGIYSNGVFFNRQHKTPTFQLLASAIILGFSANPFLLKSRGNDWNVKTVNSKGSHQVVCFFSSGLDTFMALLTNGVVETAF